jgi:hypothetical protein
MIKSGLIVVKLEGHLTDKGNNLYLSLPACVGFFERLSNFLN